ncbi:GNAT family N-acetyltransferase [Metabacillus sp. HB246100]|uniref:GNAT family N-acetyltransferase n=1 Tax=Bacillus weihaiensis TaxID=1547283 RepID=UPI0023545669|nr:GNAT family N-acetyltransferase [Bacillus weihaiensis]
MISIYEINKADVNEQLVGLSQLLCLVVNDGASLGFLPPLSSDEAIRYWENVVQEEVNLYIALHEETIVGTVQLQFCTKPNGRHRVEIAKLMTHPSYRRMGIARKLMARAEESAKQNEKKLIVLDTRDGDPSNDLYQSLGYIIAGKIPNYAKSANGNLDATVLYFKEI